MVRAVLIRSAVSSVAANGAVILFACGTSSTIVTVKLTGNVSVSLSVT